MENEQITAGYWKVKEAAVYANVSRDMVYRAMALEELRHTPIGDGPKAHKLTTKEWVDEWLRSRATGGQQ